MPSYFRQEDPMPAFALFDNLQVDDPEALAEYAARVTPIVERFGGRYVVRGGEWETLEGQWSPRFPVMIEFPDLAAARAWYHSDAYRPLRDLRHRAATVNAVLMETAELGAHRIAAGD
jgi:uncharacterized protein (DUF1330 family)